MNILLLYPKYPHTYFSFTYVLRFISKKATLPPLGLITASAMLPPTWEKKLVDLNISPLLSSDIEWADYVFISAMNIQKESVDMIIERCANYKVTLVAGGPLFTREIDNFPQIDHFILNEAEVTLPPFLKDLQHGKPLKRVYKTKDYAQISLAPVPEFGLLSKKAYASVNLQFSRGCPYACDFCEITSLLGQKVRLKSNSQIIRELDALYKQNWRGSVSIVDDNFIGNKNKVKKELLPALINWMEQHRYPFIFNVQTTIDLADDEALVSLMIKAGISTTFIGIETPSEKALSDCNKGQNRNRDMLQDVIKIQRTGMHVSGGFIVGFDTDTIAVFQQQIDFIQNSGIIWAMVGLLNAPKNTRLYKRLEAEDRLTTRMPVNNTDYSINFIPRMKQSELIQGYQMIIQNIYSSKSYYKRVRQFFRNYRPQTRRRNRLERSYITAFFKSMFTIGIIDRGRTEYWKFMLWTLMHRPHLFVDAVMFTISGYHFRNVYGVGKGASVDFFLK